MVMLACFSQPNKGAQKTQNKTVVASERGSWQPMGCNTRGVDCCTSLVAGVRRRG